MLDILDLEAHLRTGLGAAGLERGPAGKDAHHLHAKVGEDSGDRAAKTGAVGQENDDRRDTPGHAQHSECGAAAVVL